MKTIFFSLTDLQITWVQTFWNTLPRIHSDFIIPFWQRTFNVFIWVFLCNILNLSVTFKFNKLCTRRRNNFQEVYGHCPNNRRKHCLNTFDRSARKRLNRIHYLPVYRYRCFLCRKAKSPRKFIAELQLVLLGWENEGLD